MPRSETAISILGFGDSLTAGTPGYDPLDQSGDERSQYGHWLTLLGKRERGLTIEYDNQGVPGELAQHMLPRLRKIMNQRCYSIVIILAGSNDLGWGRDARAVYGHVSVLWEHALDKGSEVVACTVPPVGFAYPGLHETQSRFNEMILGAAAMYKNLIVADLFGGLSNEDGLLIPEFDSGDGLHLNTEGYRCMGELIWLRALRPLLNSTI